MWGMIVELDDWNLCKNNEQHLVGVSGVKKRQNVKKRPLSGFRCLRVHPQADLIPRPSHDHHHLGPAWRVQGDGGVRAVLAVGGGERRGGGLDRGGEGPRGRTDESRARRRAPIPVLG
jgi:hypothetical protein